MSAIFGVVALAILAGAVVLGWFVAKGGSPRTALWCVLLGVVTAATLFVAQIVQIYYQPPAVWLIALAVGLIAMVALFIRIGADVGWKGARIVALVGMVLVVLAALLFSAIALPTGNLFIPLFELRAQQMAEAQGFEVLLAPDEQMFTEYLPVTEITSVDGGVQIQYERFTLVERAVEGGLGEEELHAVLAPGTEPLGPGSVRVEQDARYETTFVQGGLALIANYADRSTAEKGSLGIEEIRVLAFARDGVLV
ncbi:MAG: hypothetical protein ACYC1X_10315, partial [Coriobacteriia bacterium]